METIQLVLPAVATFALGTALLVPLRDDRRGRRATLGGSTVPLRPEFGALRSNATLADEELTTTFNVDGATTAVSAVADGPMSSPPKDESSILGSDDRPAPFGDGIAAPPVSGTDAPFTAAPQKIVEAEPVGADDRRNASQAQSESHGFFARLRSRFSGRPKTAEVQAFSIERSDGNDGATIERSFATQLASLLGVTDQPHVEAEKSLVASDLPPPSIAADVAPSESSKSAEPITSEGSSIENDLGESVPPTHVVRPVAIGVDRVVPITRLPLRPHGLSITWTRDALGDERDPATPTDRHALLERLERDAVSVGYQTIERAYHEEDLPGRLLALRVMIAHFAAEGRATFVNALHTGTDDERALAIDGLSAGDARDALPAAFADRVDAIAARAALEYVGIADRARYRTVLSPFVDASKLEALLVLLAGIVE